MTEATMTAPDMDGAAPPVPVEAAEGKFIAPLPLPGSRVPLASYKGEGQKDARCLLGDCDYTVSGATHRDAVTRMSRHHYGYHGRAGLAV